MSNPTPKRARRAPTQARECRVELPGGLVMEFVWIRPGSFVMGTTDEEEQLVRSRHEDGDGELWFELWFGHERPAHRVRISEGFWLGKHVVTQGQWMAVMACEPWTEEEDVREGPEYPAVHLTWSNAQCLARELGRFAGGAAFRLPTEAEWEYACRAGTRSLWSCGNDGTRLGEYAWYNRAPGRRKPRHARPVGRKRPNPWGLCDMHGNVLEWCQDWYHEDGKGGPEFEGYYCHAPAVDPMGPSAGAGRVQRGGGYDTGLLGTRSASRAFARPGERRGNVGVRLVRLAGPPQGDKE